LSSITNANDVVEAFSHVISSGRLPSLSLLFMASFLLASVGGGSHRNALYKVFKE
jgi:hypothetical protein